MLILKELIVFVYKSKYDPSRSKKSKIEFAKQEKASSNSTLCGR